MTMAGGTVDGVATHYREEFTGWGAFRVRCGATVTFNRIAYWPTQTATCRACQVAGPSAADVERYGVEPEQPALPSAPDAPAAGAPPPC